MAWCCMPSEHELWRLETPLYAIDNTETLERSPTTHFGKLVRCFAHGGSFKRLQYMNVSIRVYIYHVLESPFLEPSWRRGGVFSLKWDHHTAQDHIPNWDFSGYTECKHHQVHSWEVHPHLSAIFKSSLKLWQCVSGCWECARSRSCKNVHSTNHQWVTLSSCDNH